MTNYIEKSNAVLKQTGECFKNVCDVLAKTQALNDQPSTNQKKKGIDKNFIAAAKGITDIHKCVKSYKTICKGFAEQFLILLKSLKKFLLAKLDLIKRVTTGAGGGVAGLALGEFAAFVFAWADSKHKAIFSSLSGFAGKVLESISKMLKKLISEGKVQTGRGGAMIYPTTVGTNMMTGLQKLASNGGTFLTTISKLIANWETDPCHLTFYMSNKFSLSAGPSQLHWSLV